VAVDMMNFFFSLAIITGRLKAVLLYMARKAIDLLYCPTGERWIGTKGVGTMGVSATCSHHLLVLSVFS
jgi:hypothetical protein